MLVTPTEKDIQFFDKLMEIHQELVELRKWQIKETLYHKLADKLHSGEYTLDILEYSPSVRLVVVFAEKEKILYLIQDPHHIKLESTDTGDKLPIFTGHTSPFPLLKIETVGEMSGATVLLNDGTFATIDNSGTIHKK